jgi:hypothetical protein
MFVGPAGQIALDQLKDLSRKASQYRAAHIAPLQVTIIGTPNNAAISAELETQFRQATGDAATQAKIAGKMTQRQEHPFGFFYTPEGQFAIDSREYPGIAFNVVDINMPPK